MADDWVPVGSGKATTDDWQEAAGAGEGGLLGNVGTDDPWGGVKNVATQVAGWPTQVSGALGDTRDLGDLVMSGIQSLVGRKLDRAHFMEKDPRSAEDIRKGWAEERKAKQAEPNKDLLDRALGVFDLTDAPTSAEHYRDYVKPIVGEYKPVTTEGKILGAFTSAANPLFGLGAKWKAPARILDASPSALGRITENVTRFANAPGTRRTVISGLGGVGSEVASEISGGNPYWALAGGISLPAAIEAGAGARRAIIKPQTREGQARAAAHAMAGDITDSTFVKPGEGDPRSIVRRVYERGRSALDDLPTWLKGDKAATPTIAELTGNRALALSETAAGLTDPKRGAQLGERSEARTQAQQETLTGIKDPSATGMEAREGLMDQLAQLDQRMDDVAPRGGVIEQVGANVRAPLAAAQNQATLWRDRVYTYLRNTFGEHELDLPATKQMANELMQYTPGAQRPKMADPSIKLALDMPDTVKFNFLHTYLKDLNEALAEARARQDVTQVGRLKAMKKAVWSDMNNAADNRLKQQQAAGQAGQGPGMGHNMPPDEWGAGVLADKEKWLADRAPGDKAASAVPGELFGQHGAEILKAASQAQAYLGDTFRKQTVGDLLARNEHNSAWNVIDAAVPRAAFPGGDTGHAITRGVMKAAGDSPEIIQAMKDTAIMTFRKAADAAGGRLNPKQLHKWKTDFGQSLRAIDEVEVGQGRPRFSDQFDNLANAQTSLAANFIKASEPVAARQTLGAMLADPTGDKVARLMHEAGGSPAVAEGLKTLAIDHMFSAATSTAGKNFGLQLSNMIQRYEPSLLKMFGPEHMELIKALAKDSMSQQELAARKRSIEGGSDTAHRLGIVKERMAPVNTSGVRDLVAGASLAGIGSSLYWASQSPAAALSTLAAGSAGYLMHRLRARGVNGVNDAYRLGMVDPEIGMRMLKHGAENVGDPTWWHRVGDAILRSPLTARPGLDDDSTKKKRAAGGRATYKLDCVGRAAKLCREADAIRKKHAGQTKVILHAPDDAVATALAIAGRGV